MDKFHEDVEKTTRSWRLLVFSHCCQLAQKCLTPRLWQLQMLRTSSRISTFKQTPLILPPVTDMRVASEKLGQLQRERKYPADITKKAKQKPVALRSVPYQRDTKQVMFESVDTTDNTKAKAQAGSGGIIKNQHNHSAGATKDTSKFRTKINVSAEVWTECTPEDKDKHKQGNRTNHVKNLEKKYESNAKGNAEETTD